MKRNTKFLVGALVILLICLVIFNTDLTGNAFLRFSRLKYIFTKPVSIIAAPPSIPCTDSDGEYGIFKKGTCRGILPGSEKVDIVTAGAVSDSCDGDILTEWYCENNKCVSKKVDCRRAPPYNATCWDGRCYTYP